MAQTATDTAAKTPTSGLTPRAQRTRAALLVSARTVFERDGFHAARITDIADGAQVAHGTFYTYFDTKETIFLALIDDLLQNLFPDRSGSTDESGHSDDALERLRRANRDYLAIYRDNGRLIAIWEDLAADNEEAAKRISFGSENYAERSQRQLQRLLDDGRIDPEVDPAYAARALTSMVHRFAYSWFSRDLDYDFDTAVDQLTRLWANAIRLDQT